LRGALAILLLLALSSATWVAPSYVGDNVYGDPALEQFRYAISVDCSQGVVRSLVLGPGFERVSDAKSYLTYVEVEHTLVSTERTDSSGDLRHGLPGQPRYMRGLFILLLEKPGFRNQEVYFTIEGCWS